jgi:PIN domain nuclease of toxin-antitoxin system
VILILDAHALLWWLADDPALDDGARQSIADPANEVVISVATVWEIGIKRQLGKLTAPPRLAETVEAAGFVALPITASDAEHAAALPMHHRDPFDRMVIAQAARLDATVVSRDAAFAAYDVPVLSA